MTYIILNTILRLLKISYENMKCLEQFKESNKLLSLTNEHLLEENIEGINFYKREIN